jgi:Tol biopolymer transport system component
MGEVYRARDARLARDVAIKVLPVAFSSDPDRLGRFEQEARAAAALNHPNILAVHDLGQHDGAPYIVSELLDGQTLRERLDDGPLAVRKAVDLAIQMAHGLAAAHEKGIVHRDLKPENLFLTSDGRVKVLDFGLAKLTQAEAVVASVSGLPTTPNTVPGIVLGTIGYMAPEQVRGLAADHRADIFAFGAILYEMLAGRRAFQGETSADTMSAILKEEAADLPLSERHIPPALARIVDRCLEKRPNARFQTASDLAFALQSLSSSSGSAAAIPGEPEAAHPRRTWIPWSVAALAVAIALVQAVLPYLRSAPAPPRPIRFTIEAPADTVLANTAGRMSIALSPDGHSLAFMGSKAGAPQQIWVRSLDVLEARPLSGTEGVTDLFWSAGGEHIGFFADGKLKKVAAGGGPVQSLCEALNATGGVWSKDDVILFGQSIGSLMRVPATGGRPTAALELDASRKEVGQRWPELLPDGRHVVYFSRTADANALAFGSLDTRTSTLLTPAESRAHYVPPGYLVYQSDSVIVAHAFDADRGQFSAAAVPIGDDIGPSFQNGNMPLAVSPTGVLAFRPGTTDLAQLTWVDRAGRVLATLGDAGPYLQMSLSADDKRVAVQRAVASSEIWLVDAERGVPTRFIADGAARAPVWSPSGRELAFRRGANVLRKSIAGGAESLLIASLPSVPVLEDWSRDGRYIVYVSLNALWAANLSGDRKPFEVVEASADEPQFSPDGHWLAFNSTEAGRTEVYVQPFPGPGERVRISTAGGVQPKWRGDGKELFYVAPDGNLNAVDLRIEADRVVPTKLTPLFQSGLSALIYADQYGVAADGQRFLLLKPLAREAQAPIVVVLNWASSIGQ